MQQVIPASCELVAAALLTCDLAAMPRNFSISDAGHRLAPLPHRAWPDLEFLVAVSRRSSEIVLNGLRVPVSRM
jgi:hypothetical protein